MLFLMISKRPKPIPTSILTRYDQRVVFYRITLVAQVLVIFVLIGVEIVRADTTLPFDPVIPAAIVAKAIKILECVSKGLY